MPVWRVRGGRAAVTMHFVFPCRLGVLVDIVLWHELPRVGWMSGTRDRKLHFPRPHSVSAASIGAHCPAASTEPTADNERARALPKEISCRPDMRSSFGVSRRGGLSMFGLFNFQKLDQSGNNIPPSSRHVSLWCTRCQIGVFLRLEESPC